MKNLVKNEKRLLENSFILLVLQIFTYIFTLLIMSYLGFEVAKLGFIALSQVFIIVFNIVVAITFSIIIEISVNYENRENQQKILPPKRIFLIFFKKTINYKSLMNLFHLYNKYKNNKSSERLLQHLEIK